MTAELARQEPAVLYPHRPKVRHCTGSVWLASCRFPGCTWFSAGSRECAVEDAMFHAGACRIDLATRAPIRQPELRLGYTRAFPQAMAITTCADCGRVLDAEPANAAGELPEHPARVDHQCLAIPRRWVPYPELVDALGCTWTLYWSGPLYDRPGPWYSSSIKALRLSLDTLERTEGPLTLPGFRSSRHLRPAF